MTPFRSSKQDDETGARARSKLISGGEIDEVRVGAVEIVYSSPGRVEAALDATFDEVERRGLKRIAMPVLGAVHGRLTIDRFRSLLARSLEKGAPRELARVCVITDP